MIRITVIVMMVLCGILGGYLHAWAFDNPDDAISIHGFISQGFLLSGTNDVYADTRDGSFQFNEFGLTFLTQLSNRLHAGIQVLSRDLGDVGNNAVALDWAFADYRWKDWLGFRGGVLKIPWGVYNETRDIDMLRTSIFLPSSLYDEELRDVYNAMEGIAIYGSFPFWKFGTINYQLQYGDKSLPGDYYPVEDSLGQQITIDGLDVSDIYMGTLEWETPVEGLRLRQTTGEYLFQIRGNVVLPPEFGGGTEPFTNRGNETFTITSADYSLERFSMAVESQQVWHAEDDILLEDDAAEGGWYAGVSYRLTDWLEIGSYYSVFYDDSDDRQGDKFKEQGLPAYLAWQKDLALTTRFDFGEHCTVKFEGHAMDGAARLPITPQHLPEQNTLLLAVKATVNF